MPILAAAAVLAACERPFVEPQQPTIEVVEPDLTTVIPQDSIRLMVRADAFRNVESVEVDGTQLAFDEAQQVWVQTISLRSGLNRLILTVTDSEGQSARDTAYAFQGALHVSIHGARLPVGRGGHTTTRLHDGSILVLGGSSRYGTAARDDGALLPFGAAQFRPLGAEMRVGRVGHTATALPDGRVLIVGGSRHSLVRTVNDLIETAEIYDPLTQRVTIVPFSGAPIRRAYHTALLRPDREEVILDLFGGEGDIQYSPTALLGTRDDIRSFAFRNDSLVSLSPAPGPNLGFSFAGHTQTFLDAEADRMLIAGMQRVSESNRGIAAIVEYGRPDGLFPHMTGSMVVTRTHHAAERLRNGRVLVFGGRDDPASTVYADPEIYVEEAEQFFRFLHGAGFAGRFGLTATKLSDQRILFLGGFSQTGEGVVFSEIFRMDAF